MIILYSDSILLNFIYQNARFGIIITDNIKENIEDNNFKEIIDSQYLKYFDICEKSLKLYIKLDKKEKELIKTGMNGFDVNKKLLRVRRSNKLPNILKENSIKVVENLTYYLNHYIGKNELIIDLANKLIGIENEKIERLQEFL